MPASFWYGGRFISPSTVSVTSLPIGSRFQEPVHHLLGEKLARHAQVDVDPAFGRHDVDASAALDQADIAGDAARIVGLGLDAHDLPRHLVDGAAPVLVADAGVARRPLHREREAADALA